MVAMKSPPEAFEEKNDFSKIENVIYEMLDKVMEEKDTFNSLEFGDDEIEEECSKISRYSTRHQTTDFQTQNNNFSRQYKRNLTEVINNKDTFNYFNTKFLSSNNPLIRNPSFYYQNFNNFSNNTFQNSLKSTNNRNDILSCNNNNINQSLNNHFNKNINNNFIGNSLEGSKTLFFNGEEKNLYNNSHNLFNFNNIIINDNNNHNIIHGNNNLKCENFSLNLDFKRGENRKKTYDIPFTLKNNINLKNQIINEISFNNNIDNNNSINHNKTNNTISDSFIYELKNILEKNGKIDYHIYNLIKGKFLSILKNHKGSKLFQKYLKSTHPEEIIHLLYIELSQNLDEFITDAYSNYFCKKFFSFLCPKDRIDFLRKIENSIIKFSCHNIGTYPIQSIIENINSKYEKILIISAIKDNIEKLFYDPFGCHVIEKIITFIDEEYISFIYSYISNNFIQLAYNSNGICIIKKILTFTQKNNLHKKIKKIVKENAFGLIQHPYGNFVIQVIVECWDDYNEIINLYKNNFFGLSMEKYSSNVIERFIEKEDKILNYFIDEIVNSNQIYELMKSNFGNYVIQKALKLSKYEYKNKLVYSAATHINKLIENKLIIKWKSLLFPYITELTPEQIQQLKQQKYFDE